MASSRERAEALLNAVDDLRACGTPDDGIVVVIRGYLDAATPPPPPAARERADRTRAERIAELDERIAVQTAYLDTLPFDVVRQQREQIQPLAIRI